MRILALALCLCLLPSGLSWAEEEDEVPGPRPAPSEEEEPGARPGRRGGERGGRGGGRAERLKRMDANGDGEISKDEWRGPPQFFDRMDADGDGVISAKEIEALSSRGGRGQGGQRPGQRGGGLQPGAMDTDKDGKVSKKELGDWFEKSDKNGDGFVDKDEWAAASSGRALRDPAPQVGDAAPKVSAKSLVGMDTVDLAQMTRLTVLIFGSHT